MAYMGIGVVVVIVGLIAMIVLGANVDRLPQPGGATSSRRRRVCRRLWRLLRGTPGT